MKRILLCTILLISATFSVQAQLLNAEVEETTPGQAWTLTFTLTEAARHTALSFRMALPEEIQASAITTGDALKSTHEALMGQPDGEALQVILYSPRSTFLPETGATFTVRLQPAGDEALGNAEYALLLTDIRFADAQGAETVLEDKSIVLKSTPVVDPGLPGDVNDDETLSVADVVTLLNALEGLPNDAYHATRADMDGDGEVSAGDVVLLCNQIMEQPASAQPSETLPTAAMRLRATDTTLPMNGKGISQLIVEMDDAAADEKRYSALQMQLRLPQGVGLESVTLPAELKGMETRIRLLDDGTCRLLLYANGSITFPASPATLELNLTASGEIEGTLQVFAAAAATNLGKEERLDDSSAALVVKDVSGIRQVQGAFDKEQRLYDLQGRKMNRPVQGVFIRNGKKFYQSTVR